ncbi:uncharacterized protein C2845_PM07G09230 [Panicum miliaceum]|uniref:Uncharacterized protein n=1 Tax=Panicum miliaceum TaxID=4540 RepID=A0A3L6STP1_PANMI|nr:uncharacterized protein C2845_PM07G09230 [Panicum miliaceum]
MRAVCHLALLASVLLGSMAAARRSTPCPLRIILTLAWLPDETILLDGCDFKHWLIIMEAPSGDAGNSDVTRNEIIDSYIKTLTRSSGEAGSIGSMLNSCPRSADEYTKGKGKAMDAGPLAAACRGPSIQSHRQLLAGAWRTPAGRGKVVALSGCTMAALSEGLRQGPQPYQILGVSFFLKSKTEEMNFLEKFDVELNEPYLVFKIVE